MARRLPKLSRGSLALALNALLGLLALSLAFATPGEGSPKLQLASAGGALTLANSKEGAAIFRAEAMRPGDEASGSVTITNTGTVVGALTVAPDAPADTPGQGGGELSDRLELLVIDVTTVTSPVTVYAGTLEQMDPTALGTLAPGARRTFLFVATLPLGGSADNAYQGAALTTGFTWSATGSEAPTPTPTPSATPTASPAPTASATPAPTTAPPASDAPAPLPPPSPPAAGADPTGEILGAQLFGLPAAKRCVSRRKFTIHVRHPKGIAFRSIAVTVKGRTKLRLKGLKAKKVKSTVSLKGLPKGKVVVKVKAVTTTGRKAVSKRTYRTCAAKKKRKRKR